SAGSWGRTIRRSVPAWAKGGGAGVATRADSSSSGTTTGAASASETPSRWARAAPRAGRGLAEGAQSRPQCGQETMHPLLGFPLSHAEEASLDALEAVCRQVCEEEEQAIFWRGERAVRVDGKLARGPGFAIEAPRGQMRLKRRLKGRDEL